MENNLNSQNVTILKREKIYISKNVSNKENIYGENEKFKNNSSNEFEEEVHFVKIVKRKFEEKTVKVWECGTCNKDFSHNYTLIRHLRTHSDVRSFECRECGKSFRQLSTLTQHKAIHSTERPFVCDLCDRSFNRISTLISHKKIHSENKLYKCEYCEKSFHQKGNLKNHLFIHTNARPYMCDLCKRGFNQMSNLVCHKKKFHPKDNSSIWNCSVCCMGFKKQSGLRFHELKEHPKEKQPDRLEITIKFLQNSENSKITLPMAASIHQKLNENGSFVYVVCPPDTNFNFLNEKSDEPVIEQSIVVSDEEEEIEVIDVEENVKFSEPFELPEQVFELEKPESSEIGLIEPVISETLPEIINCQPTVVDEQMISGPVDEFIDVENVDEDLSFLTDTEYMYLINAIGYEPDMDEIINFSAENNVPLNF